MIASYLCSQINTSDKPRQQRESRRIPGGHWAEGCAVRTTTANAGAFTHGEQGRVLSGPVCELALGAAEMRGVVSLPRPLLHEGPTVGGLFSSGLRSLRLPRDWHSGQRRLPPCGCQACSDCGMLADRRYRGLECVVPLCLGSFVLRSATRRPDCWSREK